jgi:hypothetical protein
VQAPLPGSAVVVTLNVAARVRTGEASRTAKAQAIANKILMAFTLTIIVNCKNTKPKSAPEISGADFGWRFNL